MRISCPCVLLLAAYVPAACCGTENSSEIKRRFLTEFPDACHRYLAKLHPFQRESESIVQDGKGAIQSKDKTQSRQTGRCGLYIITPDATSKDPTEARVVNSRYVFVLRRNQGQDDWVLHDLYDVASGLPPSIYYFGLDDSVRGYTPFWIGPMIWVPDAITQPEFVIRDAVELNENGRRFVRISYDFNKPNQPKNQTGYFVLDPERFWLVTEQEYTVSTSKSALTTKCKYEYHQVGDLPLLARMTTIKTSPFFPDHRSVTTTSFRFTREAADEMEFTLTAFGLPEPYGVEWKRRTPRYIWILVGAGGFVLLAAGLYWLARRQGAKARGDG